MPWTGATFAHHNHGLSPMQATHAAHIANHVLQSTGNEGEAIATANKLAHRDAGGMVELGGFVPSAATMNPLTQNIIQRYQSLPTEKLQELNARAGMSPQGSIIRRALQQKLAMPTQGTPAPPNAPQVGMQQARRGGGLAMGGNPMGMSLSMAQPWWTRREADERPASGFLAGTTAGRADSIKTQAPSGAYVLPADVVAGLGEGNSLAGARVLQEMLSTGPHGIPQVRGGRERGPPRPPSINEPRALQAKGGGVREGANDTTPVALSHGEFVIKPADIARVFGGGNLRRGHRVLDALVVELRSRHVKKLKSLPGPVGAKKEKKAA